MADLSPLTYGTVMGRFVAIVGDTGDGGFDPDVVPLAGTVTLTPNLPYGLVLNAVPVPTTILPRPVVITLDADGDISWNATDGVKLLATNDANVNPSGWTYTASFDLTLGDASVPYGPFDFQLPAGTTVDLTTNAPVATSPGVITVAGPIGPTGATGSVGTINAGSSVPAFTLTGGHFQGTAATIATAAGSNANRGTILFTSNSATTISSGTATLTALVVLTGSGNAPTFVVADGRYSAGGSTWDVSDAMGDRWVPVVESSISGGNWTVRIGYRSDRTSWDGVPYKAAIHYWTTLGL